MHPGMVVSVDLNQGEVTIPKDADAAAVKRAIVAAGYDVAPSPATSDTTLSDLTHAVKASCCCG